MAPETTHTLVRCESFLSALASVRLFGENFELFHGRRHGFVCAEYEALTSIE
jgi:hypothetical protein